MYEIFKGGIWIYPYDKVIHAEQYWRGNEKKLADYSTMVKNVIYQVNELYLWLQ